MMFKLLSEHQLKAWTEGLIENLRFNPDDGMLTYRITAHPESLISFKVPDARVKAWSEACPAPRGYKFREHDLSEWKRPDGYIEIVPA